MFPSPDLNRTARHLKGIEMGLLLEAKKPLERTPHFFKPESVNVLTLPANWCSRWDSNPQNFGFEPNTYASSVTRALSVTLAK